LSISLNLKQNCGITNGFAGGSTSPETTNGWNAAIDAKVKSAVGFHLATVGYLLIGV
jgi:hypothetical protein